jgi:hypothetical protein
MKAILMKLFHKHAFKQVENDPQTIWCSCGKTKDLHRCEWEMQQILEKGNIFNRATNNVIYIMRCAVCGDIKTKKAYDWLWYGIAGAVRIQPVWPILSHKCSSE